MHGNARLTPLGRLTMVLRIEAGRPVAHVAAEMGISRPTATSGGGGGRQLRGGCGGGVSSAGRGLRSPAVRGRPRAGPRSRRARRAYLAFALALVLSPSLAGAATLNQQIPLSTGVTYRLRAESHIFGGTNVGGNYSSDGGWDFVLFVPEPTTAVLAGLATFAIMGFRRPRDAAV